MRFQFVSRAVGHTRVWLMASVMVAHLSVILMSSPAMALTVEEYCTLSRDLMALSVQEWQEKAQVAGENQDASGEELSGALQAVEQTYRPQQEQLYTSYATTYDDYMRFMGTNSWAVNRYFQNNPGLMDEIEDLGGQVDGYAQQVEAVMETKREAMQ